MASNSKIKARQEENKDRGDKKFAKVLTDVRRVIDTDEEFLSHGIPGGQAFTRKAKADAR